MYKLVITSRASVISLKYIPNVKLAVAVISFRLLIHLVEDT